MIGKTRRAVTFLLVILLCMISTCVLAAFAFVRSRQVQQEQSVALKNPHVGPLIDSVFWNGDETMLTAEHLVVFDVRYTQEDKDILQRLAYEIKEEILNKGMHPIFLGAETESELRRRILNSADMELYIGLCVGSAEGKQELFGTMCFYNDAYYVPDYNNVWLCDRLLKNVVTGINGKALGIERCSERDVLVGLKVPACLLQIGYRTAPMEGELLQKAEYLESIAGGIVDTVEEYYEGEKNCICHRK